MEKGRERERLQGGGEERGKRGRGEGARGGGEAAALDSTGSEPVVRIKVYGLRDCP